MWCWCKQGVSARVFFKGPKTGEPSKNPEVFFREAFSGRGQKLGGLFQRGQSFFMSGSDAVDRATVLAPDR